MSVTFHLYELDKEVHYKGSKYCVSTKDERKKIDEMDYDKSEDFFKSIYEKNGTVVDGWDYVSLTNLKQLSKLPSMRRCKLFNKYVKKLRQFGTDKVQTFYGEIEVLPVKEVLYRQGWFLKNKFLDKNCTFFYGTTKEEVRRFFDTYLDVKGNDNRGLEAKEAFLSAWKDGMLFETAF